MPEFTRARICFITISLFVLGRIGWWISFEHQFENKILIQLLENIRLQRRKGYILLDLLMWKPTTKI